MKKSHKLFARFGLLATALPTVVLAQVINRPSNDRPAESSNTTYIVIAVVVVVVVGAFLFFRSQNKK